MYLLSIHKYKYTWSFKTHCIIIHQPSNLRFFTPFGNFAQFGKILRSWEKITLVFSHKALSIWSKLYFIELFEHQFNICDHFDGDQIDDYEALQYQCTLQQTVQGGPRVKLAGCHILANMQCRHFEPIHLRDKLQCRGSLILLTGHCVGMFLSKSSLKVQISKRRFWFIFWSQ